MKNGLKVYIVDAIMGSGKTFGAINMIKGAPDDEKFLVIAPYLDEVERYRAYCPNRNFRTPSYENGTTKLEDIKKLIKEKQDIVSTHALFDKFDDELVDLCQTGNYTLVMDEALDVVEGYEISKDDCQILMDSLVDVDPDTGRMLWRNTDHKDYTGDFARKKDLCERKRLVTYGDHLAAKVFPIEIMTAFRKAYILTYRFDLQIIRYYFDMFGVPYSYLSIRGDSVETYQFVEFDPNISYIKYDYSKLIHIVDSERMNRIGDKKYDLSKAWYDKMKKRKDPNLKTLKNNLGNFFQNMRKSKSDEDLWTTFEEFEYYVKGKGYTKGFLALNFRATNEYRTRTNIAYPVNRFLNPYVVNFFKSRGIEIDEDGWALTEMLQFIWRSAIRDGKEIWIYIPSVRMRSLLQGWIKDNPLID